MKALLFEPPKVNLKEISAPEIGPDEALVEVHACGLCGTDLVKILDPRLTRSVPRGHKRAVPRAGNTPLPAVPIGHEVAGRISKVGKKVKNFKAGDRVVVAHHVPCFKCHYCRRGSESMCREFKRTNIEPGGFSQFIRVSGRHLNFTVLKIPAGMDFITASQTEPLACCVRNARRLNAGKGDTIIIVGLGAIGLMMAQVLLARKAAVVGIDLSPERIALAQSLGVRHALAGDEKTAEAAVKSLTDGRGADAVIFTAGTPGLVAKYLSMIRDGGTINTLASFYPDPVMPLDLNSIYHREITVNSSYSAAPEDLREALKLLAAGKVDIRAYTQNQFPLDQFDAAMNRVRRREILKAIMIPGGRN